MVVPCWMFWTGEFVCSCIVVVPISSESHPANLHTKYHFTEHAVKHYAGSKATTVTIEGIFGLERLDGKWASVTLVTRVFGRKGWERRHGTYGTEVTTATTASIASRESSSRQAGITNSFLPFFHHFYEISTHVFVLIQRARDRSCRIDEQGL